MILNMTLTEKEKLKYFRGIVTVAINRKLIKKDRVELYYEICELFGYTRSFGEEEFNKAFENHYLISPPPVFDDMEVATLFVNDVIIISFLDNNLHLFELNWIKLFNDLNGTDRHLCLTNIFNYIDKPMEKFEVSHLGIYNILKKK